MNLSAVTTKRLLLLSLENEREKKMHEHIAYDVVHKGKEQTVIANEGHILLDRNGVRGR